MTQSKAGLVDEFFGGLAAMLVALPSSIAFGVIIFSPLGAQYAAMGAVAGVVGTAALGLVAPAIGGTNRLVSAPCAPAAAVLGAFAVERMGQGIDPQTVLLLLTLTALFCGILQVAFGMIGLGRLIKYVPYPVVSGYLSGVGLVIIFNQVPRFLGAPKDAHFWDALTTPQLWTKESILIGLASSVVMFTAPKITKKVPAAILGLGAGVLMYFGLALHTDALLHLVDNPLIVGPLGGGDSGGILDTIVTHWSGFSLVNTAMIGGLIIPSATLAVLLSIDTLKTCVVLDALTRSRHNSNRELIGQGMGNIATTLVGGLPGAGQMGATLVNMSSGGKTRLSSLLEGALALIAFVLFGNLVAWVPIAALAGILIVIGFRMFDWKSLHLLKSRSTILDFFVIVAVIVVAKTVSLIAASGVGIGLAILLFIREQIGGRAVRRKVYGNQIFSKQARMQDDMDILLKKGGQTVIFELQGSLFFGTTDQLYTALESEVKSCKYVILDFRRVLTVDVTATHLLELITDLVSEHGGLLILSNLPKLPEGKDFERFFEQVGLVAAKRNNRVFAELDQALEWVEDQTLEQERQSRYEEKLLNLDDFDMFKGRKDSTLATLEAAMETRHFKAGEPLFSLGDQGDELFLVRRGAIRILLPLKDGPPRHLATFNQGNFFGEMAFLDGEPRSANAVAHTDTDLFVLSRAQFETLAMVHKKLAIGLLTGLASTLAIRLRYSNAELQVAWDS